MMDLVQKNALNILTVNNVENFRNITTEDRIKEFYSEKFTL